MICTTREPTAAEIRAVERLLIDDKVLDLTNVKQPHRAATLLWAFLRHKHDAYEAFVADPRETKALGYGNTWFVCWEGGPYDWSIYLASEGNIYGAAYYWEGADIPTPYDPGQAQVLHLDNVGDWFIESYNGYSLNFIPK